METYVIISPVRNEEDYIERWNTLNLSFHGLIQKKCGNEKMDWLTEEILLRITRYRFMFLTSKKFDEYQKDHDILIDCFRRKDAKKAKENMEKHVARAKECLLNFSYQPSNYTLF